MRRYILFSFEKHLGLVNHVHIALAFRLHQIIGENAVRPRNANRMFLYRHHTGIVEIDPEVLVADLWIALSC